MSLTSSLALGQGRFSAGIIGGMVSSTATTVSYSRRAASEAALAPLGAFVIMTASCISIVRVLVEVAAVAPGQFGALRCHSAPCSCSPASLRWRLFLPGRKQTARMPEQKNPAELKPALVFGALYAIVLLAVAVAKEHFGSAGLYIVAIISGLTDLDAITSPPGNSPIRRSSNRGSPGRSSSPLSSRI